jgi:hypothetical protein
MDAWREKLANLVKPLSTKRKLLIRIAVILGVIATFAKLYPFDGVGEWTGIGKDSNKSVTTEQEINPKTKEVIKITKKETENFQSAKTLWDWLGLAGAIAIPFALFYFEQREQRRSERREQQEKKQAEQQAKREKEIAEQQAKREKEIAENNFREQVLETYIDKMSELIHKNELNSVVVSTRTLLVLRKLEQDRERQGSVIRFLIDVDLINRVDFNSVNLKGADFSQANFVHVDLKNANLSYADFIGANFVRADLSGADLSYANLRGADLSGADLRGAKNLDPEEVKEAKNWEKAKYSEEFRAKLGLPPEPAE